MSDNTLVKKIGLILPGGGARAAYQVGVLKAISTILHNGTQFPFKVISGTSAGSINAALLASEANKFHQSSIAHLIDVWANFKVNQVYRTDPLTMLRSSILWSLTIISGGVLISNPKSLLDNRPLRKLINKHIRFSNIEENLNQSNFESLAITSASYKSRKSCTFFQSSSVSTNWQRFLREGKATKINLDHLMASVALPLIFPAVQIENEYYGDGAMRQATPLSPAIRLGAEKLFIISTHETGERLPTSDYHNRYPSFEKIAGYTLDALFADGLQSDIERLDRINQIIKNTKDVEIKTDKKLMKHLDYLIIAPSEDLNDLAQKHYKCLPLTIRALLRGLGFSKDTKSEMLSFLLFESPYTQELIELGYRDGIRKKEEIINFIE